MSDPIVALSMLCLFLIFIFLNFNCIHIDGSRNLLRVLCVF